MAPHESMDSKKSTIDRNGNGGDAGVSEKRNTILSKLEKMKKSDGASARSGKDVPGGKKKQ